MNFLKKNILFERGSVEKEIAVKKNPLLLKPAQTLFK